MAGNGAEVNGEGISGGEIPETPFPVAPKINSKISFWKGDLCGLAVKAIVNTTNERLTDRSGVSGRIFNLAGPELTRECRDSEGCHTGDAIITPGFNTRAKYIIHTVGPRFSVKYLTAAENALHGCYRRCLEICVEKKIREVAFCVVNTPAKGYPREQAAHIAIRTVRRFLEKYGDKIDTVVLAVEDDIVVLLHDVCTLALFFFLFSVVWMLGAWLR